jgi:glycosyltransferase involved in cell wall biosynthesis
MRKNRIELVEIVGDGRPSGGTTVVLSLLKDLKNQTDWKLHLIAQESSYAIEEASKTGIETHGVDFFRSRINFKAIKQLKELIRKINPDLIHAHAARSAFPLSYALEENRTFPVIYTVHAYHFLKKHFLMRYLGALAERKCHQMADATTFVSLDDCKIAKDWKLLPEDARTRLIYNGICPGDFPDTKEPDLKKIAFFGSLIYQKHPELFVEMADILKNDGLSFVMIGGGDLAPEIERLIKKYGLEDVIELTGQIPRQKAIEILNGCGILVHPSRWDAPAIVLMEAAILNVAIISSDAAGLPEFVIDEETGILVKERKAEIYAEAVRKLIRNRNLREKVVTGARDLLLKKFIRTHCTNQYIELYEELLAKGQKGNQATENTVQQNRL